ncbi:DNA polymerase III subunit beta family protein [Streptomyces hydrogenans]
MPVTLNAHQFARLIDRTADHIGDHTLPVLHGVRLEADAEHLYAVATDRYTLAAARYRHHRLDGAPFTRTVPARALPALRRWLTDQPGDAAVALTPTDGKLRFATAAGEMTLTTDDAQDYIGWRGLLRDVLTQTTDRPEDDADNDREHLSVLDARLLTRFTTADTHLRIRTGPGGAPALLVGEDFLGAQSPLRSGHESVGAGTDDTLGGVRALWETSLTDPAGHTPVPMPGPRHHDAPRASAEAFEALLRQTMASTRDLMEEIDSPRAVAAHAAAGASSWAAYRYLDALHRADPLLAAQVIAEVAAELDDGALGEFAYDAAANAGFNPQPWIDELDQAATAASEPTAEAPVTPGTDS